MPRFKLSLHELLEHTARFIDAECQAGHFTADPAPEGLIAVERNHLFAEDV